MAKGKIELAQLIGELRAELEKAEEQAQGEQLKFKLDPIELELKVTATQAAGAKAGVKFWVLEFGADGKIEQASVQTLKLRLVPQKAQGGEVLVSRRGKRPR